MNKREIPSPFIEIANEIGQLVTDKNYAYGNSFNESEKILKVLFPRGVRVPKNTL